MAELYDWLSGIFGDDGEASGLFLRMAMEEASHANLIRYGCKLVHQSPDAFDTVDFDVAEVDCLVALIREARRQNPPLSLGEAIALAMRFEDSPAERPHRSILMNANPAVSGVIQSLAAADDEHTAGLRRFADGRRLSVG